MFPFIVAGIASGALYGLAATGLVLTYKTSGVLNFGHGAVAAAAAFGYYDLRTRQGLHWALALAAVVLVLAPLLGVALEVLGRSLSRADSAGRITATVGVLVLVQGIVAARYGTAPLPYPAFLSRSTFRLGSVNVGYDQVSTVAISLVCVLALLSFFRWSRLGLQMRAIVDDADLLDLTGVDPVRVRRDAWVIGCVFAALSGILLAGTVGLDLTVLTLLVIQAFGAASVGRFRSLGLTFASAIGIGIAGEVVKRYVPDQPVLAGVPSSLPFLVLFVVLLFSRRSPHREPGRRARLGSRASLPPAVVAVGGAGALVLVAVIPFVVGARLPVYTNAAIFTMIFVSLALLVHLSAQVSLCQMSFAAVGATTFAHLQSVGVPWPVACLAAGLVAVPVGALLSVPAIRLSGLYLALATFGFAILVEQLVFRTFVMFGGFSVRTAERPHAFGLDSDRGFYYLCATLAVASIVLALAVSRSRLGRLLNGVADSPTALMTHGADVNVTRVMVFCLAAFMAGVAGVLLITLSGSASASGTTFGFFQSLFLLVVLFISGRSLVASPVVAAILLAVLPSYSTDPRFGSTQQIVFGVAAIAAVVFWPSVRDAVGRAGVRTQWRRASSPVAARTAGSAPVSTTGALP